MKKRFYCTRIFFVSLFLISGISSYAQKAGTDSDKCYNKTTVFKGLELNKPGPDKTITLTTYNSASLRSYKIIVAKKDANGKLYNVVCAKVRFKKCHELEYKVGTVNPGDSIYISYRNKNRLHLWYVNSKVKREEDPKIPCKSQKGKTVAPRPGMSGDKGSTGTATTSISEN